LYINLQLKHDDENLMNVQSRRHALTGFAVEALLLVFFGQSPAANYDSDLCTTKQADLIEVGYPDIIDVPASK